MYRRHSLVGNDVKGSRGHGQTIAPQSFAVPPQNAPATEPIYQTSAYLFPDVEGALQAHAQGPPFYFYSRQASPNQRSLEAAVAALEAAEAGAATASGMAAISGACLACTRSGGHIVASSQLYGGTFELLSTVLPSLGIRTDFVDIYNLEAVRVAVRDNTRMIYVETVSNPTIRVANLPALADLAAKSPSRPFLVVDNTFATPYGCRPLALGASLSIHSLSKFMGGHNDLIGGIACGLPELIDQVGYLTKVFGWAITPFNAWLAARGVRTLWVRMRAANENANQVAQSLARHQKIKRVFYPGLPAHPDHLVAQEVLRGGFGAMLALEIDGGFERVSAMMRALKHIRFTPTLGGVATTISHPASTSHRQLTHEARIQLGIADGLVRISVGIEDPQDIVQDLEAALERI